MSEILYFVLKIIAIVIFAMFLGKKTGLFSMGKLASFITLAFLLGLFGLELYSSFFRNDISLVIKFSSSFLNFTLDLSFFIRVLLAVFLMGLLCSCLGVRLSARISTAKDLCTLAILVAITVLLAVYGTVRVGTGIKVSFKFISVFITAALFGPLWGGVVAALADVIAFVINPVGGVFLPQITMVEFLYGFTYGLFFYNMGTWQGFKTMFKLICCVILQIIVLNLGMTTYFLVPIMKMSFNNLLIMRSVSAVVSMALQLVILSFISKYIQSFRKVLK